MNQGPKASRPVDEGLLVLDYGSQYTLLIARRLRELGIYAEVIDGLAARPPDGFTVHGIILSGGPDSVYEAHARKLLKAHDRMAPHDPRIERAMRGGTARG